MKLTKENYYSQEANQRYLSVSQFKDFCPVFQGCESRALAKLRGGYEEEEKTAFIEGKLLHAWNEGPEAFADFKLNNPDLYSSRGSTAGQLKSNFQHCYKMIEILENDPLCMKALSGQKEVIFTAEFLGAEWKMMADSYQPEVGIFADLKALKEMDGKFWNKEAQIYENFLEHYGYSLQMAVYAEIEKRATGRENWLIPHMVIVTKQDPPDHDIIYFDYDAIQRNLNIVEKHIERVKAVKKGEVEPEMCGKCAYCRSVKKVIHIRHYSELNLY